jgi:hypothetical protein
VKVASCNLIAQSPREQHRGTGVKLQGKTILSARAGRTGSACASRGSCAIKVRNADRHGPDGRARIEAAQADGFEGRSRRSGRACEGVEAVLAGLARAVRSISSINNAGMGADARFPHGAACRSR